MKKSLRSRPGAGSDAGLRTVVWTAVAGLVAFVGWAALADIDQVTRAPAQIISSSRTQLIQAADGGVMTQLLVREGAKVQRGQVLARFDATRLKAAYAEVEARAAGLRATVQRAEAELTGTEPRFDPIVKRYPQFITNQVALLAKRRAAINEEMASLARMQALAERELNMTSPLVKTGDVSMADVLRLERQVADLKGQASLRRNRYLQDLQAELSKAQEDLAGVEQVLVQRREQLANTELTAPVNGVVSNVKVTTIGGVLRPGEELMQIVPLEDDLLVEARVRPGDVAFLKPGLPASVKVDAYDYTVYGSIQGTVSYISADTLSEGLKQGEQAYYRVQVKTRGREFSGRPGVSLEIQPGMTAMVEIKTGSNTVLRYLAKPVVKTLNEAMGER